jgi:ubiquinone/menaquinone biosynthesis C-methylase UbiE
MRKQISDHKKYVPALGYHLLTPFYDLLMRITGHESRLKNDFMMLAQLDDTQHVLDLGCGTGSLAMLIKREFPSIDITALDCDKKILSIAADKVVKAQVDIQFVHAFAEDLPCPDNCFDRILSSLLFHHLCWDRKQQVACEMFRVLKSGGEIHILDWGRASNWVMRTLFFSVQLVDGFTNTQENVSGRLVELFQNAGFTGVSEQQSFDTVFGTLVHYRALKSNDDQLSA